jgi:hypothetical protein
MANPADSGPAGGTAQQPGTLAGRSAGRTTAIHEEAQADQPHPSFHGRPVSWVAVSLIMIAFVVGGLALIFGPTWWLFWVAVGVVVVGGLLALSTNIFEDWY